MINLFLKRLGERKYRRAILYILFMVIPIIIIVTPYMHIERDIDPFIHIIFGLIVFLCAIVIGIIAIVSYYSQKGNSFLFIGSGFIGTGFLELQHITFNLSINLLDGNSIIHLWNWFSPRLFLSILLWLAWLIDTGLINSNNRINSKNKKYFYATFITLLSFFLYVLFPSTPFFFGFMKYIRYLLFLPAGFFFFTLIGYLNREKWKDNYFEHWLIIALIINFSAELSFNMYLYEIRPTDDVAHLLVIFSYLFVFIGMVYHMYDQYKQVEVNAEKIAAINLQLREEIKEKKETEKKIFESEERYRHLVEHSPDMIAVTNNEKWVYINSNGVKFLKAKSRDEIIGKPIYNVIAPDYHNDVKRRLIESYIKKDKFAEVSQEVYVTLDGRKIDVEVKDISIVYDGVPSTLIIVRDITERIKNDELLRQSEKLLAVGELAAGIAHEIRNPLTSLKGFVQLLQSGTPEKEEYFQVMLSELKGIELIIGEFLFLAKPHELNYRKSSVKDIIDNVILILNPEAIMNNVQIVLDIKDDLPLIQCEINQIKQLLINIIKNAIEAMPKGGKVNLKIGISNDNSLNIQVIDKGIGIPKNILPYLGKPFFSTKDEGTGLGLMISYKIVENHKGKISVNSIQNKGTTVEINLPLTQ